MTKAEERMMITGMVTGLYNDPVMRATMGMGILRENLSPASNIMGAAILADAFKGMRR